MRAYVLVQTDPGHDDIAARLRALPGVIVAHPLRGPYDAIAHVGAHPAAAPLEGVVAAIRDLPGVMRAITAPLTRREPGTESDQAA